MLPALDSLFSSASQGILTVPLFFFVFVLGICISD